MDLTPKCFQILPRFPENIHRASDTSSLLSANTSSCFLCLFAGRKIIRAVKERTGRRRCYRAHHRCKWGLPSDKAATALVRITAEGREGGAISLGQGSPESRSDNICHRCHTGKPSVPLRTPPVVYLDAKGLLFCLRCRLDSTVELHLSSEVF